jgi:hypothetical protein
MQVGVEPALIVPADRNYIGRITRVPGRGVDAEVVLEVQVRLAQPVVIAEDAVFGHRTVLLPLSPAAGPHSWSSLLTVAQLRAVPASRADVGPPALASMRRSSLRGYPSGVCR